MLKVPVTWANTPLKDMSGDQIRYAKEKLKEAWEAELPEEAVYRHTGLSKEEIEVIKDKDPVFAELAEESVGVLNRNSRINVARAITEEGDVGMSWKYLEKTDPEFKKSSSEEGSRIVVTVAEREEALKSLLENFDPGDVDFDISLPADSTDQAQGKPKE